MKNSDMMKIVRDIISFSPRQLANEKKTAKYIMTFLKKEKVDIIIEKYDVLIPVTKKANLFADGVSVECDGCSTVSGQISGKDHMMSSLSFDSKPKSAFISFNPCCSSVSLPVFYTRPAVSVSHQSLQKILTAQHVQGNVYVEKVLHRSCNILVGNHIDPQKICFTHYDSIKTGAIDNASGVAVVMEMVRMRQDLLQDILFVIAGNEELSCDDDVYWGNGYRDFEKRHVDLMEHAAKIVVVDSVGNGSARVIKDKEMLLLGFPVKRVDQFYDKIDFVSGDYAHLMTVYHSNDDDGRGMTEKHMQDAYALTCALLNDARKI